MTLDLVKHGDICSGHEWQKLKEVLKRRAKTILGRERVVEINQTVRILQLC